MKKIIFILFIAHYSLQIANCFAQQPTQEWVARIPGPINDLYGPFLEVDKQGNSYIAGVIKVNDTSKVFCAKYNANGVQLWSAFYIYPSEAYILTSGLALDSSGNAYVIADQGPAYDLPTNGLIVKFNSSSGNMVWDRRYIGQYGWGAFRDIKVDRLNNIYVVGWTDSSHLVIRYNTEGDSVWVRKYRPPWGVREVTRACAIDDSLNIIFTGQRRFFYTFGNYDSLLVAKYSPGGILRWESVYAYNYIGSDVGIKITPDQNGNLYIGGVSTISAYAVYLTLKYDRNGFQQWTKIYDAPGSGDNYLRSIVFDRNNNAFFVTGGAVTNGVQMATTIKYNIITGDSLWIKKDTGTYKYGDARAIQKDTIGNIYVTGVSSSTGSGAPVDILTIKYSQTGIRNWIMTYNGPYNGLDIGRDIGIDKLNNIYVLGTSQSGFQITDYVVIKYDQLVGIEPISNVTPNEYKLLQNYPNPFNPYTKIRFLIAKSSSVQIKIYDVLGREIKEIVNSELKPAYYEVDFDGSNYSSGVYFYQLIADGSIIDTKKMIVIK